MTDLLTKEERAVIDSVRGANKLRVELLNCGPATEDCDKLIAIIDNLSKRGAKKYSEEELRAVFEGWTQHDTSFGIIPGTYDIYGTQMEWRGFYACANFLGALEEK